MVLLLFVIIVLIAIVHLPLHIAGEILPGVRLKRLGVCRRLVFRAKTYVTFHRDTGGASPVVSHELFDFIVMENLSCRYLPRE
jgi:hypothetical protein